MQGALPFTALDGGKEALEVGLRHTCGLRYGWVDLINWESAAFETTPAIVDRRQSVCQGGRENAVEVGDADVRKQALQPTRQRAATSAGTVSAGAQVSHILGDPEVVALAEQREEVPGDGRQGSAAHPSPATCRREWRVPHESCTREPSSPRGTTFRCGPIGRSSGIAPGRRSRPRLGGS